MGTVFVAHGVTAERQGLAFRNCIGIDTAVAFLRECKTPLVRLEHLNATGGDALTVDDSTMAGAQFCRLARSLGHEVTFFINPSNVELSMPHWFVVLDSALDASARSETVFGGRQFSLRGRRDRKTFRSAVKTAIRQCGTDDEVEEVLREALSGLDVRDPQISAELLPPSVNELRDLLRCGVVIESHGWSHLEVRTLTDDAFRRHIAYSRQWLSAVLGVESTAYAVPFGESVVASHLRENMAIYVLADSNMPAGCAGDSLLNRVEIPLRRESLA